jgi:hypothetical protein
VGGLMTAARLSGLDRPTVFEQKRKLPYDAHRE